MRSRRWQHGLVLAGGAWLVCSPLLFASYDAAGVAAVWASHIMGATLLVLASIALVSPRAWLDWTILAVGCWLVVAPLAFGFSNMDGVATSNLMIVGMAMGLDALSLIALHREDPRADQVGHS